MKKILLIMLTTCVFCTAAVLAQTQSSEVRKIDAVAKAIDARTKRPRAAKLVFADVSDYDSDAPAKWQQFASEKELEKHREKSETYTIAYVWLDGRKVSATNFTLFSPSGDWTKYVYSYFRSDGSLARAESELRTFYGDFIGIRRHYLGADGKTIRETVKFLDLKTRKPKKPSNEFLDSNPAWDSRDYFRTTDKLPFAHLLSKK